MNSNMNHTDRDSEDALLIDVDNINKPNSENNIINEDEVSPAKSHDGTSNKYESNASLLIRYFFLISILLQNSAYTLLRRYNKGVLRDESSNASMLIGGEFMKICVSLFMGIRAYCNGSTTGFDIDNNGSISNYFITLIRTSPKLAFPAFIYLCMNWLSLLSLERIDASTFTVIAQCKTLSTAFAGYFFLGKRFSESRIRSLIYLVCAVIVITYVASEEESKETKNNHHDHSVNKINGDDNDNASSSMGKFMMGVIFVLIEVTLSGCVSVYYEKVLKDDKNTLSVWDRNIQLATFSIIMYFYSFSNEGYFSHWSIITFFVSFLGALGGVLVAFSIKYTDSVLKAMSTSCAIVLTSVLSYFLLDGPYNVPIAFSSIIVVVAIFTYVTDGQAPCDKSGQ